MIWVDIAVLVIIGISAVISLLRGFIREALSLFAWVAAFAMGFYFTEAVAAVLEPMITGPTLRMLVAFLAMFFGTLLLIAVFNYFIIKLVKASGLTGTDRMIGVVFGIARGCVVVLLLVLLAGLTTMPQEPWWNQSMFLGGFEQAAVKAREFLPSNIASYIQY